MQAEILKKLQSLISLEDEITVDDISKWLIDQRSELRNKLKQLN